LASGSPLFGIESNVLSLTSNKVQRTHEFDGHKGFTSRRNFKCASTDFSLSVLWRFNELALQQDIIHYHFPWPFMDVLHFLCRVKKPTIVTYHSDIIRQKYLLKLYAPLMHRFLQSVDLIVVTSPNYFATSDVLHRYKDKVTVIPIGLDKANYPIPTQDRLSYWKHKLGSKFFLFIGVMRYYKGLHILMEAAQGTDYPIAILGAGPVEKEIKDHAQRLALTNIHFLGALPDEDKVALLTLSYAVLFPSHLRSEAFGISLLEGAMYGKPMISSEIGTGTTFINISNETGLVVPPSDPEALRDAMRMLWEQPEMAAEMGRKAENRYRTHFTAKKMTASYAELYKSLLASSGS
jgi:O-antigen biosynthesis rhamnosyltransferase